VAGGYGAGSALEYKWTYNTVWAPTTVTTAESFLWYRAHPRVRLGVAHLWKQNALRWLASVNLAAETATLPALNASVGVQGIGTGNPGYSATLEKNFGAFNGYLGVGWRSNESHSHLLGGVKYAFENGVSVGLQLDGHQEHPFVVYTEGQMVYGAYLIDLKSPALMVGYRF
jgi:hypothetical protein